MAAVKAKFVPKSLTTLRPGLAAFSGREFAFEYAGVGDKGEVCPGQTRWMFAREHDAELGPGLAGRWVPEEDLQPKPSAPF